MRKNQLSFSLETFGDQTPNKKRNFKLHGYIDANNLEEVLNEQLKEIHKLFRPDMSFENFVEKIKDFNGQRFGDKEITTRESRD